VLSQISDLDAGSNQLGERSYADVRDVIRAALAVPIEQTLSAAECADSPAQGEPSKTRLRMNSSGALGLIRDRQLAHARARRRVDRIGHCRRDR
jgi:hypothetical protein